MDADLDDVKLLESWYLSCYEEFIYVCRKGCLCLYVCERKRQTDSKTVLKNMANSFLNFSLHS